LKLIYILFVSVTVETNIPYVTSVKKITLHAGTNSKIRSLRDISSLFQLQLKRICILFVSVTVETIILFASVTDTVATIISVTVAVETIYILFVSVTVQVVQPD
jgi:hypothetical protein